MIIRNLNFLVHDQFSKVEISILENKNLGLVYIENSGYSLIWGENEEIKDIFLIKSELKPQDFKLEENKKEKEDFIDLLHMFLNKIYDGTDIPEYEKQHHEFVFLKIIDLFEKNEVEYIDKTSELYKTINEGLMKLDIDILFVNGGNNG